MAKSLPDEFPPAEESYSLYEGIEYQGFWDDPRLGRQDALEQHIISDMLPASGRRILDLGCGYGRLAPCYLNRFEHSVLCDGSLSLLRDARSALGDKVVLVAADIAHLPFKTASYDCVLTIRVLQHVHDLQGVFDEVRRISARGGRLVFSYHNKRNAKQIPRYFAARGAANPFSREPTEPVPTLISRHPKVVEQLIHDAGFSQPEYQGTALVHPLASITDRFGSRTPAGARWAPFMGRFRLAPWLIGTSIAQGGEGLREEAPNGDIFECPACRGELVRSSDAFECTVCHRGYPTDDGIADFRLGSLE